MRSRAPGLAVLAAAAVAVLAGCGNDGSAWSASAATPGPARTPVASRLAHGSTAVPAAVKLRENERFLELSMARRYTPNPPENGTDDYRCFVVDPHLTRPTVLTGSQFLPNNPEVVHHAIFFKLDPKDVRAARALDAAAPGDGWTCFTGTGIGSQATQLGGAPWLAAWAPGAGESLAPPNTGFEMEPGTHIIMQIHYNLLATGGKATGSDQSGIRLRLRSATKAITPLHTTLLVAPIELPCAPGETGRLCDRTMALWDVSRRFGDEAGYQVAGLNLICTGSLEPRPGNTQHCDQTIRARMVVYAVAGHMHLLGTSIRVDLNPGSRDAWNLLNVRVYNFDDQSAHRLAEPVTVNPGDHLRVTCTHDATLRSKLPALKLLQPRYVVWGEGTSDEMCLGVVVWASRAA